MKRRTLPLAIAATFVLSAPALAGGDKHGRASQSEYRDSQQVSHELSNEKVRQVQQALQSKGHAAGPIDGIYGPLTASALREFQQAQGLTASGRMDDQTLVGLGVTGSYRTSDASSTRASSGASVDSGSSPTGT